MADISSYLAAIMAAVYGEDVRGSIHDAIDIINKVGEVVLNTGTAVTGPTSSSTGFYDGSFYINTNTYELWKCIGTDAWQSQGVLKGADGADGSGIASIVKTSTVGLVDTYTITFDDGSTETYQVTNGQNGSKWYKGTAISGTGTSITGFPGVINDFYLNSVDGYVYTCTKTGGSLPPDAAEWDYVMTLTGGGGASITVVDNLTSTSTTDALSANQGRVLKGMVDAKIANPVTKSDGQVLTYDGINDVWKAATPSSSVSDLDDLSDVTITSPANDQVLKYSNGLWVNGAAPAGGHTMIPVAGDMATIAALNNGDDNYVINAYSAKRWSNCDAKVVLALASQGDDGIGDWEAEGTWETGSRSGWLWSADLYHVLNDGATPPTTNYDVEVMPVFDGGENETVSLYAFRIDDNVSNGGVNGGAVAFKFNTPIQSANGVRVGVKIINQRTDVTITGTILT